ncbi:MAG: ABC transporter substrate-binding protein [Deltaproteobacteria bacterium]|nr:ABC transporter substrate-binding protein [Deltaproteobacteria bacterium]
MVLAFAFSSATPAQEVRVGTWKTPQTIQPFFYEDFLPKPLAVQVFPFTNPADQKTALLAGSLHMCGTTVAHAIQSAAQGQPVVLVAAMCNKSSALVVKHDGAVRQVSDLRGMRIGYVPGTMHEILLRETLTRNGLSPDKDVRLIRVDFFDMGLALAGGAIDAFLSGEPLPTLAADQGYGRILAYPYYDDSIGTINAGMLVRRETIQKNPDLVFRLVLAHARATKHLAAHRDQWFKKAATFGTPLHILEKAAPNLELAWIMDDRFVARAESLGARMQTLGIIQRQPEYAKLFDLTFVRRVSAEIGP